MAFFGYDPKRDLERVAVPVLNLVGGRDRIAPPKAVRDAMAAALPKHRSHVFHELSEADHSMLAPVRVGDRVVCQLLLPDYLTRLTEWVTNMTGPTRHPCQDASVDSHGRYTLRVDPRLPGADLVARGVADLARGVESEESLLVSVGAARLRALGIAIDRAFDDPERRLFARLSAENPDSAHTRYNALIRRLVSFERAAECERPRT